MFWLLAGALWASVSLGADPESVKVKGERVNLRGRPDANGEVVGQVTVGEELTVRKIGDTWVETGPNGELYSWHVAIAVRPRIWVCSTFGPIGHDKDGGGGIEGRITVQYRFLRPGTILK